MRVGLAVLGLTVVAAASHAALGAKTPNVIIFYADDMGSGDVGCYGAADLKTPHIDALAGSGMRFTSYYAPAPICSPSRAAMLTGRYPHRAGLSNTRNIASAMDKPGLPTREITLAELARAKGYATAVFGKWHLGSTPECQPNSQGFDLFFGHHASCVDSYSHWYYASEPWYHDLYRNRQEVYEDGVHMVDLITRETLVFIDKHRDKPFLVYVAYNTPHYPMVTPGKYLRMYDHLPPARRLWGALVSLTDDSIGRIMARLTERNLLHDTLIFFASDNGAPDSSLRGEGGGSNAPYREYKRSLFEGGIRVPGIVSRPGTIPSKTVCDQPVIGMDIFATAAQAIGARLPADRTIDGTSWYPLFRDPGQPVHDALFFEWNGQYAVRSGRWKLVENGFINQEVARNNRATGEDKIFLADVLADPGEQTNLRPAHGDMAQRLDAMHEAWRKAIATDPTASPDALEDSR